MRTSDAINDLATALSKAQAAMNGAKKDALNPHFHSQYADLASVWEACRAALTANGLSVVQSPRLVTSGENGLIIEVETLLLHASGQWLADSLSIPVSKPDAQGVGSAITYARRYALAAIAGIAPEDDDGESAVGRNGKTGQLAKLPTAPKPVPEGYQDWLDDLAIVAESGTMPLKAAWTTSSVEYRDYVTAVQPEKWEAIKKIAAKPVNA